MRLSTLDNADIQVLDGIFSQQLGGNQRPSFEQLVYALHDVFAPQGTDINTVQEALNTAQTVLSAARSVEVWASDVIAGNPSKSYSNAQDVEWAVNKILKEHNCAIVNNGLGIYQAGYNLGNVWVDWEDDKIWGKLWKRRSPQELAKPYGNA